MADCVISGTLYKTVGASASETLNSFTFYVSKGLLSGSGIGQSKVAITTHASNGTFSFAAQQGELIRVTGDFVVGDYSFKDGLELFVPVAGTASFTSLKTPRDYVRALTTTTGNAPNDATYILQTADADLANAQALGALATGILKNTTSTGVLSIATAGTDYLPSINGLTADASPDGAADYVVTYDASASAHKKVLLNNLPGGGGGSVSSVFGRTGAVVAASNDYTWAQIDKTTSSIADITTRSASDLSSGTLAAARGGAGTVNGILKADGAGLVSAAASGTDYAPATSGTAILKGNGSGGFSNAASGTDYEVPLTFSTGLTRSTNTITVNTSQNIATLSNLTSNGLVTTSGGAGTLGVTVPGTGVLTALGVNVGSAGAFVVNGGALGTPASGTLTNATGLPISTGVSGLGTGVATALAVNTGSAGAVVLFNGAGGTPSSLTLTNATGLPLSTGVTGDLPFANFVQAGSAGFVGATGAGDYSHRTPTQVTAALDNFVGDSGSGGTKGLVPAPASGDAAASKYLKADGTWATVAASSGITIGTTAITSGTATRLLYETAGNVVGEISGATSDGTTVTLTSPTVNTGITLNAAPLTMSGNISAAAWTTNGIRIKGVAATLTDTTSSGTVAAAYTNNLGGNTIAASSSTTFTDYYTTFINGPTAGTNVTFTRSWALGLSGAGQINQNSVGTTSTDGWVLQNSTAAAAGAQQYSPRIRLTGQGWKTNATAASQTVDWLIENQPVQGAANPTTNLVIASQVDGGGYTSRISFGSDNVATVPSGFTFSYPDATTIAFRGAGSGSGVDFRPANVSVVKIDYNGTRQASNKSLFWSNTSDNANNTLDTGIARPSAATLRITNASTGAGNLIIGTSAGAIGTSGAGVLAMALSTAPTTSPADVAQLWAADMQATAGNHGFHIRNEINTAALILPGVRYKTDTGDPTDLFEGMFVINTFDNTAKIYADGALRTIATW